jgi:hypothetical protein
MKNKSLTLLLVIFLVLNLSITIIKAEDSSTPPGTTTPQIPGGEINPETGLPKNLEKAQEIGETITDSDKSTAYLKQEWQKILEKSAVFGPIVKFIFKLDPVSVFLLGIKISFSWLFFLTLILFIDLLIYMMRIIWAFLFNIWGIIRYTILILFAAVLVFYRVPLFMANFIVKIISMANVWWMQFIIIGIVILALILAGIFSKELKLVLNSVKEHNEKFKEKLNNNEVKDKMDMLDDLRKTFINK